MRSLIALCLLLAATARAEAPATYTWYDGRRPVRVYLDPAHLARVDAHDPVHPAVTALVPAAEADTAAAGGTFVPVFTSRPGGGQRMALPGHVLLYLSPALDAAAARAWIEAQKLRALLVINPAKNGYLIEAPPGLPSLLLANRLHSLDGVVSAAPLWWRQVAKR